MLWLCLVTFWLYILFYFERWYYRKGEFENKNDVFNILEEIIMFKSSGKMEIISILVKTYFTVTVKLGLQKFESFNLVLRE